MKKILTALCLLTAAGAGAAPQLIAHRGGTGVRRENTYRPLKLAAERITPKPSRVTVRLSRDGVPVLYRSKSDLSTVTQ